MDQLHTRALFLAVIGGAAMLSGWRLFLVGPRLSERIIGVLAAIMGLISILMALGFLGIGG